MERPDVVPAPSADATWAPPVRKPFDAPSPWLPWLAMGLVAGAAGAVPPTWWWLALPTASLLFLVRSAPVAARGLLFIAAMLAGASIAGPSPVKDPAGPRLLAITGTVTNVLWTGTGQGLAVAVTQSDDPGGYRPARLVVSGEPLPACLPGDRIAARGRWTRDDRGERLEAIELERIQRREDSPRGWAWAVMDRLASHRELASALLLGYGAPPEKPLFRQTGLLHVLAVSGMHLAIAAALGAWLLRVVGVAWLPRTIAVAALAIGYAWLTGLAPATVRALAMLAALTIYSLLARRAHPLGAVALAALVLVGMEPAMARDLGFQLSLVAVLGLLTLGRDLIHWREQRWPLHPWPLDRPTWCGVLWLARAALDGLAIGVAATLATAPVLACTIGGVAWWGPVATLLAAPPSTVALWLGLPLVLLAGLWPNGPWEGLYRLLEWSLDALIRAVELAAILPGQTAMTVPPTPVLLLWPLIFLPGGAIGWSVAMRMSLAAALTGWWFAMGRTGG